MKQINLGKYNNLKVQVIITTQSLDPTGAVEYEDKEPLEDIVDLKWAIMEALTCFDGLTLLSYKISNDPFKCFCGQLELTVHHNEPGEPEENIIYNIRILDYLPGMSISIIEEEFEECEEPDPKDFTKKINGEYSNDVEIRNKINQMITEYLDSVK